MKQVTCIVKKVTLFPEFLPSITYGAYYMDITHAYYMELFFIQFAPSFCHTTYMRYGQLRVPKHCIFDVAIFSSHSQGPHA